MMRMREGEMAAEPQVKEKITNAEGKHVKSGAHSVGHLPTNHKRKASKTFQIHGCKDIATVGHRQTSYENSVDKSLRTLNKATAMEGSCAQTHTKNGSDCSCRSVGHQKCNQLSEINLQVKMNEAAEAFINQKFVEGKFLDKKKARYQSKHFLDALEILNSNKELFTSLLQDPNSLLVKHIQDLRQSQEHGCNQNSSDRDSTKGSFGPQTERIVALKPGSSAGDTNDCSSQASLYSSRNRGQSDKPTYFSFGHIKRKLRHAIGLNRKVKNTSTDFTRHKSPCDIQGLGDGRKGKGREIGENNSMSEYKLGTSEVAKCSSVKRKDKLGNVRDSESGIKKQAAFNDGYENSIFSVVRHLKQSDYNIHIEASKCLSEVLRNRNVDSSKKQVPINSRRIVSLPEYDFLSACSLERHQDHGLSAAQMRFPPYSYNQMVNEKKQQLQKVKINGYFSPVRHITEVPSLADYQRFTDQLQIFDTKPNDSGKKISDIKRHENVCSLSDTSSSRGSVSNTVNRGEINTLSMPLESPNLHSNDGNQNTVPANKYEDNDHLECSKLDFPQESCASPSSEDAYSSSSLSIKTLEDSYGKKDKTEHGSPVSVLDQYILQDIMSPLSTISQSADPAVEPKQENYEEHHSSALVASSPDMKINSSKSMNEHDSMSKYITTLLQASGIKWKELPMKLHSSDQLLEPALLDEVELLPNQITIDQKLLFDYINEVLLEIYQCYFCCTPWVSFLKPKVQPVHYGVNLVYEVMKCIDLDILFHQQFQTLDQLVEKDLTKSITWMDIQIDTEVAVTELVESVLEELALEISIDLQT